MAVILSGGDGKGKGGGEKGERQMERCGRLQYNISSSGGDTHTFHTLLLPHLARKKEKDAIKLYSCSSERVLRCYAACCCVCMHACVSYRRERE